MVELIEIETIWGKETPDGFEVEAREVTSFYDEKEEVYYDLPPENSKIVGRLEVIEFI